MSYIINALFFSEMDNRFDSWNYISVHHVFDWDLLHAVHQTFQVSAAVFADLDLVDDGNDSSFEDIVTFTVRERDYFALVDLTVGFTGLVVQGNLCLQEFRSPFFHSEWVDVRGFAFAYGLDEEYFQRLFGRRG